MNEERSDKIAACGAYFRTNPHYGRAMQAMADKWRKYGRTTGIIRLEKPSEAEREILEGFLGDLILESRPELLRFTASGFEKALQRTKFRGICLEELLSACFQEPMVTGKQQRAEARSRKASFLQGLLEEAVGVYGEESRSAQWMKQLISQRKHGYKLLSGIYERDMDYAEAQVKHVYRALAFLEARPGIRLAVLGSEITGNPHQFDRDMDAGKLLLQAIRFFHEGRASLSAEHVLELYMLAGIKPDDISSFTTACGIHLHTEQGLHPAYEGFIENGEPYLISLSNLNRIRHVSVRGGVVYAVENQMVFSQLCEAMQGHEVGMLCTSGQLKTASLILLDLLCDSGYSILYCGDLDPEGISIAARLVERGKGAVIPWHMSREDHVDSVSNERISDKSRHLLEKVQLPCLKDARDAVLETGRAGFQEKLLDQMLEDIRAGLKP